MLDQNLSPLALNDLHHVIPVAKSFMLCLSATFSSLLPQSTNMMLYTGVYPSHPKHRWIVDPAALKMGA